MTAAIYTRGTVRKVAIAGSRHDGDSRFVFFFQQRTYVMAWGRGIDEALDNAFDWIEDYAPGLFCDDECAAEYKRAIEEGCTEDAAYKRSDEGTTHAGNAGHAMRSDDWGFAANETTDREGILAFLHDRPRRSHHEIMIERAIRILRSQGGLPPVEERTARA